MTQIVSDEAVTQLRRLMELRDDRDQATATLRRAEEAYRDAEADAYESLEGVEGAIKIALGDPWGTVAFHQRETYFARVIDPDKAHEHYVSQGMAEEVAQPKFRMKILNEDIRDRREQGQAPPPGVDWVPRRGVTITRQKG